MKFTPIRKDTKFRVIYAVLLILSIICFFPGFSGIIYTVMQSIGIFLITASLFMFIKYESTILSYILIEKNGHFDFYVDKHTGKRGTYVCYFPVSDAVKLIKMEDNTKAELRKEFKSIYFYNYGKNVFCGDKYIIVFENGDHHDAIIFEPDEKLIALIRDDMDRYKADADAD